MARQNGLLIAGLLALGASALGQAPEADKEEPAAPGFLNRRRNISPEFENAFKALEALDPQQRKKFHENFLRWSNLPPEEKKALRGQQEMRRQRMAEEIRAVIRQSGLMLEGERRQQFIKRYSEERRKVEEQLRRETEEKRKPLIKEVLERLKEEFTAMGTPVPPVPPAEPPVPATPSPPVPANP